MLLVLSTAFTLSQAFRTSAAIMAENIIFGLFNASERFKDDPITVFAQLWRIIVPSFGKGIDKPADIAGLGTEALAPASTGRHSRRDDGAVG